MSIGIHAKVLTKMNLIESMEYGFEELKGSECCQVFTHGPHNENQNNFDVEDMKRQCAAKRVYTHQTYRTSWKPAGLRHMRDQLECATMIGSRGLVLHLALLSPQDHIKVLKQLTITTTPVILEMRALKPQKWAYQTAAEINMLCSALKAAGLAPERCCICLDTAHLSAGKIPIRTRTQVSEFIESLTDWNYIKLLHLNGNEYDPLVRAGDKHCCAILDKNDKIWGGMKLEETGCLEFVKWMVEEQKRDAIIEVELGIPVKKFYNELVAQIDFNFILE